MLHSVFFNQYIMMPYELLVFWCRCSNLNGFSVGLPSWEVMFLLVSQTTLGSSHPTSPLENVPQSWLDHLTAFTYILKDYPAGNPSGYEKTGWGMGYENYFISATKPKLKTRKETRIKDIQLQFPSNFSPYRYQSNPALLNSLPPAILLFSSLSFIFSVVFNFSA